MRYDILANGRKITETKMNEFLSRTGYKYDRLIDAMDYSVSSGGKRIRPALLLEFYRICGGTDIDGAACFAAALEFVQTYSLIHDDLPCMDNDDMRRGKPSCHIAFGEDTALLAGDGLLTLAFFAASSAENIPSHLALKAVKLLSSYSGIHGMVGGQAIDLAIEGGSPTADTLKRMYSLKTCALIKSACEIGCTLADASEEKIAAARLFAENLGLAFQITDDILDIVGSEEELGKPVGSDTKNQKTTYAALLGLENARAEVTKLTDNAVGALSAFGDGADELKRLAYELITRKK